LMTFFVLLASLASRSASFMDGNLSASCAAIVVYGTDDQFRVD
jgi:hypothetical protein